jgi:type IV pilus assembly protein PilB
MDAFNKKYSLDYGTDDAPIISLVQKILLDAIHKGASDIHFEPYETSYRIRMRIDGILYQIATPPLALANRIAARIKVLSQLDIAKRFIPQDGGFKMHLPSKQLMDFRVSTCPTITGEKIVIRILDPLNISSDFETLGLETFQKEMLVNALNKPQGMILVTGPTGCGKSVTMYTALHRLNEEKRNISSVEDPVEIQVPGINQVNINPKAGLTFATVLRAFLRQDPDVMMVGEMRDQETAEICLKAAETGHLVLSTLHTNSATETLTRLAHMGLPSYHIATSLSLIIAQRLARKLCENCKVIITLAKTAPKEAEFAENLLKEGSKVYIPGKCKQCIDGYKGRTGIFEVLPITTSLREGILAGFNALDLAKKAKAAGMISLKETSLLKVQQGITSLQEVISN